MSDSFYAVRINSKKSKPREDFAKFLHDLSENGLSFWDNTRGNKIRKGDHVGFIIGEAKTAKVLLFTVTGILTPENRLIQWRTGGIGYTVGKKDVSNRGVICFSQQTPVEYAWKTWKEETTYKPKFWPSAFYRVRTPEGVKEMLKC
jgi:hypothetical protein